jgi:hypothetical protein
MAFAEDMSVFFDPAVFAVSATFAPSAGGAAQTASVLLDMPTEDVLGGGSLSDEFSMQYAATDLPAIRKGDEGLIAGVRYRVREIRLVEDGRVKRALLTRV